MPKVTFLVSGQSFEIAAGGSYLDLCNKQDAPQDFGCTVGSCGTCRVEIVQGASNVNPITPEERETLAMVTDRKDARLGCQLVVHGDIQVRPID